MLATQVLWHSNRGFLFPCFRGVMSKDTRRAPAAHPEAEPERSPVSDPGTRGSSGRGGCSGVAPERHRASQQSLSPTITAYPTIGITWGHHALQNILQPALPPVALIPFLGCCCLVTMSVKELRIFLTVIAIFSLISHFVFSPSAGPCVPQTRDTE